MAWQLVSEENLCPVCCKPDRCKIAPDGNAVKCFRVAEENAEWRVTKKHTTGGATFQRRGAQRQPRVARPAAASAPSRKTSLSSERLHEAYSLLLGKLSLEVLHRISLHKRGLNDEQIAKFGYKSMPSRPARSKIAAGLASALGDDFAEVPGFAIVDGKPKLCGASGTAIPVRNANGEIVAVMIRADGDSAPKYTVLSSSSEKYGGTSPGAPAHVPITVRAPATKVRLTEGHLKADVINALDPTTPTISCPGVSMYQKGIDAAKELGAETIIMAFDADAPANHDVARPLLAAVRAIVANGLQVELERWPIADGKGLDDLLAAGKKPELLVGVAAIAAAEGFVAAAGAAPASPWTQTSVPLPSANDELVNRVQKVLETGDISALFKSENAELLRSIAAINLVDRQLFSQIRTEVRKAKVPMKDFDFAMKKLIEAAAREQPPTISRDSYGGFFEDQQSGCISRTRNSVDGPITVPMCNFIAYVVDETTRDDGAEKRIVLGLEGQLSPILSDGRKLPRVEVASDKFPDLRWVLEQWGTDAIVHPNESRALPSAILLLSQSGLECNKKRKVRRTVYEHTGWKDIDGQWHYLHSGGALNGVVTSKPSFSVDLDPPLNSYRFPKPPVGEELKAAIRSSLALLTLAPRRLVFPLLAATYRSVLGPCDFGVSLVGRSGIGKTAIAALMQQHFGATMDARHLPGSWSSTSNSLERVAFLCGAALLVVDDYAPAGDPNSVQKYRQAAERVFRSQGNNAGRQRMKSDGSLRAANPPRGLIMSTGEDVAGGQSARARQLILDISPGDINLPDLTPHQLLADEGVFASALSGFINWIAPRYNKVQATMRKQVKSLRDQAKSETQHARTPGIVADLQFGFLLFLEFARRAGAITEEQGHALKSECWAALSAAAKLQEAHQSASDPVQQFLSLLSSALGAGRVHVDDAEFGGPPDLSTRTSWGWREDGAGKSKDWRPRGQRIGWVDDTCIFLDPTAAFAEVQKYASEQTLSIPVTQGTLFKMLATRGLLAATDPNRETLMIRKTFPGTKRTSVISLFVDCLSGVENPTNPTTSGDDNGELVRSTAAIDAEERSSFPLTQAPNADLQPRGRVNGRVNLALPTTNGDEKPLENVEESECWSGWSGEITLEKVQAELEEYEF